MPIKILTNAQKFEMFGVFKAARSNNESVQTELNARQNAQI